MGQSKSINTFVFLFFVAILFAMGAEAYDNDMVRYGSYFVEILLILYALFQSYWGDIVIKNKYVLICAVIIILNYLFSPYDHNYSDLLKFFGYLCCFKYGYTLSRQYNDLKVNKLLLALVVFFPIFMVAVYDDSYIKNTFFTNPNTFVYTGLSMGLLYLICNDAKPKAFWIAWIIVGLYVLTCTSLGVVVAILMAFLILNIRMSHIPYLLLSLIVLFIVIKYIDIPLFVRIRDVFNLWSSMSSSDLANLNDINYYELNSRVEINGEREDVGSSVWRLAHWLELFLDYIKNIWTIPFGLGVGYSVYKTDFLAHNDFLFILTEMGVVVFIFFIRIITTLFKGMKNEGKFIYFILAMFFYHFTENLIQTFPPNAILYFVVGWCMYKYCDGNQKNLTYESFTNK